MRFTDPVLTLTFLGNDIQPGHSAEQTIDYEDIIQGSIHKRPQLLNGLKSSGSVCEIAISRDCLSTEDIIATDGDIEAVLSDNGSPIFTGYLSTKYSWIVGNHGEEALALTIEDVGTRRLTGNFIESGYHLFNTSAKNAVKAVCDACGITISESAIDIPQQIFRVVDSTMTNKQIIDEILYSCNHVYYFDNLGEMNFFEVNVVSVTGRTIGSSDLVVRNGRAIQLTKDVRTYRSARVTYHPLGEAENYLIYRNTTGQDSSHPYCYIELKPGEHFDGAEIYSAAEWAEAMADEFRLPTLIEAVNADSETALVGSNKIVSVSNVRIVADKDSSITASIVGVGGPYIKIDCQNTSAHVAYIRRLDAVASIVFENGTSIVNAGVSDGSTQTRLEETTECLHDRESVTKHANLLSQFNAYCNSKYTFSSTQLISLGEIVTIEDTTYTGLSVAVMVIAYADSDKHNVIDYTAIGVAVFDLDKEAYHQNTDIGKSETKGRSSQWITGTVLEGDSFARGVAGLVDDMYLNTDTYNLYKCVQDGDSHTALWQYIGNIKGADATSEGLTYEIQYGLSDSDEVFNFPDATIGYTEGTFGAIDPEDDEQFEYGFKNYDWSPSTEGWYKGLYVWTRVKITDSVGNITYGEPSYCKDLTEAMVNATVFTVVPDSETFVVNKADSSQDTHTATLKFTGFSTAEASNPIYSVTVLNNDGTSTGISDVSYSGSTISFKVSRNTNASQISIRVIGIHDQSLVGTLDSAIPGCQEDSTAFMTATDITVYDVFGGIFDSDSDAEDYFTNEYGGLLEGYTYAYNHEGYADHLALRTYFSNGWLKMTNLPSSFSLPRVSAICAKAQKQVLSMIPEGSVTLSDFGYFNIVIANVVTARFIGSKQIQLQVDDNGNAGYIYGGDVDPSQAFKSRVGQQGFIIDTLGQMEASSAYFKNCEIDGASIVSSLLFSNGAEINHPYLKTISSQGIDMAVQSLPSKTHWYTGDIDWTNVLATANAFVDFANSYINNNVGIDWGLRVTNPNTVLIASGTTVASKTVYCGSATLIGSVQYTGIYTLSVNNGNFRTGTVYVNGIAVMSSAGNASIDVTLNKGDTVTCSISGQSTASSTFSVVAKTVTLASGGFTNVGIYLHGTSPDTTYFYSTFNEYKASSVRWLFKNSSSVTLFDSNSHIDYAHLESIVSNYMSSLSSGKTYTATGSVTYNGVSCTVATLSKDSATTGKITIFDSVPNFYVLTMSADSYHNISGNVQILASQAGIETHAMYPETTEAYDIGEGGKQYRRIYCVNVVESSRRDLKTNIKPFTDDALALLKTVEVSKYNYKADMDLPEEDRTDYIGYIADDTDARLSGKKHDRFNHINCIGVLIKAVQELAADIESLKKEQNNG